MSYSNNFINSINFNCKVQRSSKRGVRFGALLATVALAASACSGSEPVDGVDVPGSAATPLVVDPTAAETPITASEVPPPPVPVAASDSTLTTDPPPISTPLPTPDPTPSPPPAPPAPAPDPTPGPGPQTPPPPPAPTPDPDPTPNPDPANSINDLGITAGGFTGVGVELVNPCAAYTGSTDRLYPTTSAFDALGDGTADDQMTVFFDGTDWILEVDVAGGHTSYMQLDGYDDNAVHSILGPVRFADNAHQDTVVAHRASNDALSLVSLYRLDDDDCLSTGEAFYYGGKGSTTWYSLTCDDDGSSVAAVRISAAGTSGSFNVEVVPYLADGTHGYSENTVRSATDPLVLNRGNNTCPGLLS